MSTIDDPTIEGTMTEDEAPVQSFRGPSLGWGFWVAATWLVVILGFALLAPVLPIAGPEEARVGPPNQGPSFDSFESLFGYDRLGRSVMSRVIWGSRISLRIGLGAVGIGLVIGGTIGLIAGYMRRWVEGLTNILTDAMLAFPPLVLLIALAGALGQSATNIMVGLAILGIPTMARLARANTLVFAQRDFIVASRAMGARDRRIVFREILPNVALPMVSYAFIIVAVLIVAEGSLSFLGVGVQRPTPSWGGMIAQGQQDIDTLPHTVFAPALVMFLTILSFNRVGDGLRQLWDPRASQL